MSSTINRAEIDALFQQLVKAHADHDADAIVEAYAPDAGSSSVAHHVHASQRLHLTVSSRRAYSGFRQHLQAGVRRLQRCAT